MLLALACLHLSLFQRNLFLYIVLSFLSWFITVICDPWIKTQQCFTCYTHVLTAFVNTDRGERLILPAWNVLHIARWNLTISSQNSISLVFFFKNILLPLMFAAPQLTTLLRISKCGSFCISSELQTTHFWRGLL